MKQSDFESVYKLINALKAFELDGWEMDDITLTYLTQGQVNIYFKRKEQK